MITLRITDVTDTNRTEKFREAVCRLSKALGTPVTVKPRKHDHRGERWAFLALEEVVERHKAILPDILDELYQALTAHLGLPMVTKFRKAKQDAPLVFRGSVIYDARLGTPLTQRQFKAIIQTIEQFLNRKLAQEEERIVLDSIAVGKLLNRMLKYNTADALEHVGLDRLNHNGETFASLSESMGKIADAFGLSRTERERYAACEEIAAQYITDASNAVRSDVRRTLTRGVLYRQSKSEVAQELLHEFAAQNRDWHRVVETKMSDISNTAALNDMLSTADGEPVYVKRIERMDSRTCRFCRQAVERDVIARVLPVARDTERIGDAVTSIAIWPGKSNFGRSQDDWWWPAGPVHPYCRGFWVPYDPPDEDDDFLQRYADRLNAELSANNKRWGEAMKQARSEFAEMGVQNPGENTPGFMDRVRAIDRSLKERNV